MITLTVERLTCPNFLFHILPYIVFLKLTGPAQDIRVSFIDASRLGSRSAQAVLRVFSIPLAPLTFRSFDLLDDQGDSLRLTLLYTGLLHMRQQFCEEPFFKEILNAADRRRQSLHFYLKKSAVSHVYNDTAPLWQLLMMIHALSRWKRQQREEAQECFLFADRRAWMKSLQAYARKQGVSFRSMGRVSMNYTKMIKAIIGEERIKFLYAFLYKLKILRPSVPGQDNNEEKLVLEYYGSFHLDHPEYYSDFTFWQRSSFPGKDILVSTQLTRAPFNKEQFQLMRAQGISAVALHPKATGTDQIPVFCGRQHNFHSGRISLKWSKEHPYEAQWARKLEQDFYHQVQYYRSFFKTVNARIYLSWFKYTAHHAAIAEAINSLGGIMAMHQRSMEQAPSADTAAYCDVFFGFNALGRDIERRSGSRIPYYVITGYLGDHRFAYLKPLAVKIRGQLRSKGARRIIAFFDENSGLDVRWGDGHMQTRTNYAFLLEKVLSEPWLGLVIKPKAPSTLKKRLGPVAALLDEALATGRCYLVSENIGLQGYYPPALAALAADIAIHGHLCAATAGVEAALAGVHTLIMDGEGFHDMMVRPRLGSAVVFRCWDDLWRMCCDHWRQPIDGFGDWSGYLNEFDPFRDGRAAERMGTYLRWLMDGFKAKLTSGQVLAQAAERYAAQWGKDKIISDGL